MPYFEKERELDLEKLRVLWTEAYQSFRALMPETRVVVELGRFLMGPCGALITKVRFKKTSFGEEFLVVDGGTNLHMAAVGLGSFVKRNFPIRKIADDSEPTREYQIAGPLCTPNDLLGSKVSMPQCEVGDLIGVFQSGAYGASASPTGFISHGFPAELAFEDEELRLIRQRQSVQDLIKDQLLTRKESL